MIGTDLSVAQLHTLADHQRAEIERLTERCQRMEARVADLEAGKHTIVAYDTILYSALQHIAKEKRDTWSAFVAQQAMASIPGKAEVKRLAAVVEAAKKLFEAEDECRATEDDTYLLNHEMAMSKFHHWRDTLRAAVAALRELGIEEGTEG